MDHVNKENVKECIIEFTDNAIKLKMKEQNKI
jgi:hypothetical protein